MTDLEVRVLNAIRRRVMRMEPALPASLPVTLTGQAAANAILSLILKDAPAMVARFGATEMDALRRFSTRSEHGRGGVRLRFGYAMGRGDQFFYDRDLRWRMDNWSGFFPTTDEALDRFGARNLDDARQLDLLGSWLADESRVRRFFPSAQVCPLRELEPYFHERPWTAALEGLRVLVVHPFAETIRQQYRNRHRIWRERAILPAFDLVTLKALQTIAGERNGTASWFDGLAEMEAGIASADFDVALIGAGAYGFPLAAHVKRLGKKAIHLGGALQILFGIRGARWDARPEFQALMNDHWVRPSPDETPRSAQVVEGACYW